MLRLSVLMLLSMLLSSCGSGTDENEPFQPGIFEGKLEVHMDKETSHQDRENCRIITTAFAQGGVYRLNIKEQGDSDMMLVEHEDIDGIDIIAEIDDRQTAFGGQEEGRIYYSSDTGRQAECRFTFKGHFVSEAYDRIYESGKIEGKCWDDSKSADCVFRHDMFLKRM